VGIKNLVFRLFKKHKNLKSLYVRFVLFCVLCTVGYNCNNLSQAAGIDDADLSGSLSVVTCNTILLA